MILPQILAAGTELNRRRQPFQETEALLTANYKDVEGCETPVMTCRIKKNGLRLRAKGARLCWSLAPSHRETRASVASCRSKPLPLSCPVSGRTEYRE
jgi:hypothetical protein